MQGMQEKIHARLSGLKAELAAVSRYIHDNPEIGLAERKAAAKLVAVLKSHGFSVKHPVGDTETAFQATLSGEADTPHIAILAEYDALPNIGHACGHNLIATAALGAGLALMDILPDLKGRVSVIGTPAEEILTGSGKMRLVDAGIFDDVDVAMMVHPHCHTWIDKPFLGVDELSVTFKGKPAHAASSPHFGVNACDALQLTLTGINFLRQQVRQDARIHWGNFDIGGAVNVIPDVSSATICVRASDDAYTKALTARVIDCIEGAARMTGCRTEYGVSEGYRAMKYNASLNGIYRKALDRLGVPVDELPPHGRAGSNDMGNVSQVVPALHPFFKIHDEAVPHTVEFREAAQTDRALEAALAAAEAMAVTAMELITQPDQVAAAKAEFEQP